MATKKFRCTVCGYIHEGDKAPAICPVCKADSSAFEEITSGSDTGKKKINTNSNVYTLLYASIMVVIVAVVLAFTHSSLSSTQNANERLDKKKQILSAIHIDTKGKDAEATYTQYIRKDMIVNGAGEVVSENGGFDVLNGDDAYALYLAEVDGATKYILPLNGTGLWGAIWGYIALNADKNTVYGVFFSHASETPGLGAEIVTPAFKDPFIGKHIMKDGKFVSIAVLKKGKRPEHGEEYVDAISGGTITSTGVSNMLRICMSKYEKFLTKK
ncbi:MAG: NADH:ubiquinone reductase (Na(+)-transporting) subunit C [Bacteroidaceae bacterium]